MAESMIERIARVLCTREGGDPDQVRHGEGHAAGQSWLGWQVYTTDAKAVLAAMREPTYEMKSAGGSKLPREVEDPADGDDAAGDVFEAMIVAALEEEYAPLGKAAR